MGPTLPFKHYRMATLIVLDMRSATTTSHRADFTRTMSVAIAISFRYAWARAGASFTPFPTMPRKEVHRCGEAGQRSNHLPWESSTLPAANSPWRPPLTWPSAGLVATARAVHSLSPESITTSLPKSFSSLNGGPGLWLFLQPLPASTKSCRSRRHTPQRVFSFKLLFQLWHSPAFAGPNTRH